MTFETGLRHAQAEVIFYHQTVSSAIVQVIEDDVESFVNESTPLTMAGMEAAINQEFGRHNLRCTGALQMHVRDAWPSPEMENGR